MTRRRRRLGWVLLGMMSLPAACMRDGDENLGIGGRRGAIDLRELTRPEVLVRAISQPGRTIEARKGAHRWMATSSIKVATPNAPPYELSETYRLDTDGRAALHLWHDNDHGTGAEAVLSDGLLYVRPRYGRFVKRRPEGDEVDRLRAQVEGVPAGYLELLQPWLVIREKGRSEVSGRPAIKLELKAAPNAAPPKESEATRKWRQTLKVEYLEGELVVDAQTGIPVEGRLDAAYRFEREGEKAPVKVTLAYKQWSDVPEAILAPPDAIDEPRRTRPILERNQLLDGLVTH
jgi:hypothetical protein